MLVCVDKKMMNFDKENLIKTKKTKKGNQCERMDVLKIEKEIRKTKKTDEN